MEIQDFGPLAAFSEANLSSPFPYNKSQISSFYVLLCFPLGADPFQVRSSPVSQRPSKKAFVYAFPIWRSTQKGRGAGCDNRPHGLWSVHPAHPWQPCQRSWHLLSASALLWPLLLLPGRPTLPLNMALGSVRRPTSTPNCLSSVRTLYDLLHRLFCRFFTIDRESGSPQRIWWH
jgi:hypothetical protein